MAIEFNPAISSYNYRPQHVNFSANNIANTTVPQEKPENNKSGFKEDLSKIAKFFTTLSEMTKATVKGVAFGGVTGAAFLSGFWLFKALPKGFRKGQSLTNVFKHPLKSIGTKGKVISGIAALAVASAHIIKGKLRANQRTANVDHQLKTGHRPAIGL